MEAPRPIIDPLEGPTLALSGHVVTMNPNRQTREDGVVYLSQGGIVAVQDRGQEPPAGFADVPVTPTGGVIYPGLIELHNHIAYNALPLWQVPQKFTDRNRWAALPEKRRRVTAPMAVLAGTPDLLPAVARYVEVKALLGGTTTTQGFRLNNAGGAVRYYRGLVRNVEQTEDPALRNAGGSIPDVRAQDAAHFLTKLNRFACYFLHLSEGTDPPTRKHFLDLKLASGSWALTNALAAIHATALEPADFKVLAEHQASVVWSPLSNFLLYGKTMNLKSARAKKLRIGLGSDWSVSGSKSLFAELKVARLVTREIDAGLEDEDLVAMATCDAAAILHWDGALGSLEAGKRADLLVLRSGDEADPYAALLDARETDIRLVLINGVPRYGIPSLMKKVGVTEGEGIRVGGLDRRLYLEQETVDPAVGRISFTKARDTLEDALHRLPQLARKLDHQPVGALPETDPDRWHLALDEMVFDDFDAAPAAGNIAPQGILAALGLGAVSLESLVSPIDLDPPTVADDHGFLNSLDRQPNLPAYLKTGLRHAFT
jgi:cytosine/adenosine deaminase-related metal-dependent hydrolase